MQTDPPPLSLQAEIQTDPLPEPTPPPHTVSIEIQTDEPEFEEEAEASTSGTSMSEEDETLASSSSTILPPTPKSSLTHDHQDIHAHDLPPAYDQASEDLALRIANETLKTWHKGLHFPVQPIEGGVSDDAVEDWKALKEELGVECMAIDKLIEESGHSARPRVSAASTGAGVGGGKHRRSRFYNIYNTYVYGDRSGSPSSPHTNSRLTSSQFLFCIGASAAVAFLVGHAMAPPYAVPGGATYYDRAAWDSFNSVRVGGEGFPGDGGAATAALWGFIGRLGGGAARTLRGWPT